MTRAIPSWTRRAAWAICLTLGLAGTAAAQRIAPAPADPIPDAPQFMARYNFHLTADATASGDKAFWFDSHIGADFDIVDYKNGRANLLADYQAVLGKQIRPFDPNQGNYLLEGSSSYRMGAVELFGVFHHESRHLGDRAKIQAIAWNVVQARVLYHATVGGSALQLRGDAGKVVQHSWVDYAWTVDAEARLDRTVSRHAAVYGSAYAETYGVRKDEHPRGQQTGGRVEAGVRLGGKEGAIDLFAGYERVIDADAFLQQPLSWGFAGFRLVSK
jgi:hypothetical protein